METEINEETNIKYVHTHMMQGQQDEGRGSGGKPKKC